MAQHDSSALSSPVSDQDTAPFSDSGGEVLIATLGRSPQVGTRTFDELYFKRKIPLTHVVWIHSREENPVIKASIDRVRYEVKHYYAERCPRVTFHYEVIEGRVTEMGRHRPIDTRTREDAEAVMYTLHKQLNFWKERNNTVHLSISGGPKVLAAFGVAAAQLTFDSDRDKCWHLVAQDQVASRREMHVAPEVPEDEVRLIDVPVLRWKTWKEWASRSLAEAIAQDPLHAQDIVAQLGASEMFGWRCQFVEDLNADERGILEKVSLLGLENEEIDEERGGSCRNVITRIWRSYCEHIHKQALGSYYDYQKELRVLDKARLRRGRLIADFHLVFQQRKEKELRSK